MINHHYCKNKLKVICIFAGWTVCVFVVCLGNSFAAIPMDGVMVQEIRVMGSTVIPEDDIVKTAKSFTGRVLTAEDMEMLRRALTQLYIDAGYINSGAVLPDQVIEDGRLTYTITYGRLNQVFISGNTWFRDSYLINRLNRNIDTPLSLFSLQENLILLRQNPFIDTVQAALKPGLCPGDSELWVSVKESVPWRVGVRVNNYQSPTIGGERGQLFVRHASLTGNGDTLYLAYGRSSGMKPQVDVSYQLPVNRHDTLVSAWYQKNDSRVVENRFDDLNVISQSDRYGFGIDHPFFIKETIRFSMGLSGEYLHNKTYLLGVPYSFSLGAEDGESTISVIRFSQEFTMRTTRNVLAIRSRFSRGITAFGASKSAEKNVPDSDYFSWLGQAQWAQRFSRLNLQSIMRLDAQIADSPLMPLEQMAVGGRYTVRGYRENTMVRDNGVVASIECRMPMVEHAAWADQLRGAVFYDMGRAWNTRHKTLEPDYISSVGLGFLWDLSHNGNHGFDASAELFWGIPFRDMDVADWDIQDSGIHFQVSVSGF